MFFNSIEFAAFLPTVLLVYYCLPRKPQNVWLLAASYFFYGWWDWRFMALVTRHLNHRGFLRWAQDVGTPKGEAPPLPSSEYLRQPWNSGLLQVF